MNTVALRKYAKLFFAKKKLKGKLKEIEGRLKKQEKGLLDHLADLEIDKVSLKGGITLFKKRVIWAKITDKEGANNAILEAGQGWMIKDNFNSLTLSVFLRELNEQGKDLPESFEGVIEANPVDSLIAKKL